MAMLLRTRKFKIALGLKVLVFVSVTLVYLGLASLSSETQGNDSRDFGKNAFDNEDSRDDPNVPFV